VRARLASIVSLAVLSLASGAAAQSFEATVTLSADRTAVEVGDVFHLEVRAELTGADRAELELPDLAAFDVLNRNVSTQMQFSHLFGGRPVAGAVRTYRFIVRARQAGTFELAPAAVVGPNGQRYESNRLTIQVGGSGAAPPGQAVDPVEPSENGAPFDPEAFVHTVVDEPRPYVGQQVTVTVYLYTRRALHGGLQITQEPTAEGFWVHDLLPPARSLNPQRRRVNGLDFDAYVVRQFAAFPLREGPLTIGPTGLTVGGGGGGLFGMLGGGPPMSRTGVPVTIEAQPLPAAGRPPGTVHVGSLELSAELDRGQVATGDAVQLTVTARGVGQLRQLDLPSPSGPGLRVLEPEIHDEVTAPPVGGTRTFRWLIVPERPGTATLGPFEVPVFDPATRTYSVARAPALTLTAAGNPTSAAAEPEEEANAPQADAPELSLRPIRTRSALFRSPSRLVADAPWLPYAFGVAPLLFACALVVRLARQRGGGAARANKTRAREAKRRLSSAAAHATANAPAEFYAAIAQALKELLEVKLERSVGSLTHPELRRVLIARGLQEPVAERVVDELEGCDFARFAAAGIRPEEMQLCLTRTRALLDELERFTPRPEEA